MTARIRTSPDPDQYKGRPVPGAKKRPTNKQAYDVSRKHESDEEEDENVNNPSGERRRVITNHEEENKITNAGDSSAPLDEKETEGV